MNGEETVTPKPPRGAIPRAQAAILLLREATVAGNIRAAERHLWLAWCSVCRLLAERESGTPYRDSGRAA